MVKPGFDDEESKLMDLIPWLSGINRPRSREEAVNAALEKFGNLRFGNVIKRLIAYNERSASGEYVRHPADLEEAIQYLQIALDQSLKTSNSNSKEFVRLAEKIRKCKELIEESRNSFRLALKSADDWIMAKPGNHLPYHKDVQGSLTAASRVSSALIKARISAADALKCLTPILKDSQRLAISGGERSCRVFNAVSSAERCLFSALPVLEAAANDRVVYTDWGISPRENPQWGKMKGSIWVKRYFPKNWGDAELHRFESLNLETKKFVTDYNDAFRVNHCPPPGATSVVFLDRQEELTIVNVSPAEHVQYRMDIRENATVTRTFREPKTGAVLRRETTRYTRIQSDNSLWVDQSINDYPNREFLIKESGQIAPIESLPIPGEAKTER